MILNVFLAEQKKSLVVGLLYCVSVNTDDVRFSVLELNESPRRQFRLNAQIFVFEFQICNGWVR